MGMFLDLINVVILLMPLIIWLVSLYLYFMVGKKDKTTLLLGLGFLFLWLAIFISTPIFGLNLFGFLNFTILEDGAVDVTLVPILYLIGYILLLVMVEPWKIMSKKTASA